MAASGTKVPLAGTNRGLPAAAGSLAAAAWCEEHGRADDAVRHALAAADPAWAARLVERHADAFLLRSEGATLQRWLAALPAGLASPP